MAFSVSPGVTVTEIDTTTVVPAVSTTEGAIAGVFRWGPIDEAVLVTNEDELAARFGKPTNFNAETFFVAADFLSYGNALYVSRAANTNGTGVLSAIANTGEANVSLHIIKNEDDFQAKQGTLSANVQYIARYAGALGNSLKISQCDSATQYRSTVANTVIFPANASINATTTAVRFIPGEAYAEVTVRPANTSIADSLIQGYTQAAVNAVANALTSGDLIQVGGAWFGFVNTGSVTVTSTANGFIGTARINLNAPFNQIGEVTVRDLDRAWEFYQIVDRAPGQSDFVATSGNTAASDELHLVITDAAGQITGTPGAILEVYQGLSRATNAKKEDGSTLFYKNVLNDQSSYVWAVSDRTNATSTTANLISSSGNVKPSTQQFTGGSDGFGESLIDLGSIAAAYDVFASPENLDISIIMAGKALGGARGEGVAKYIKDNIAERRKDVIVTVSPAREDVVNNKGQELNDVVAFFNAVGPSSYLVWDSGYKYRYDKYNDIYRYVPLNGDIAGLMVRTDNARDPWFSPAGFNRGQIKNIVKLAWNPNSAERDVLYRNSVNPVVTFPGQGTILYGDKTGLNKPSAFDRINVRRLFIVLEKAISNAAKFSLFEFNDDFTRAQFRSLVEPFLRDVQGRRGILDYRVVCDTTNNTPEVIDRNEFIGDIYIKPSKSINFIRLNFVAVRTGVEFSEIVGQV